MRNDDNQQIDEITIRFQDNIIVDEPEMAKLIRKRIGVATGQDIKINIIKNIPKINAITTNQILNSVLDIFQNSKIIYHRQNQYGDDAK